MLWQITIHGIGSDRGTLSAKGEHAPAPVRRKGGFLERNPGRLQLAPVRVVSRDDWRIETDFCIAICNRTYYHPPMKILTVKLPTELHATLTSEARRRNVTRSSLVREIIERALTRDADAAPPSCAGLAGDLVGAVRSGRPDLATNRHLLDEAVYQDAHRGIADRRR
ncbi:MAG: ribbon-helix-helix domain-containing protein [Thiotrichales bacterium]|nr:ribbon-helix-helix domain-containing protein [Thiotrichales bacterium]